MAAVGFGPRGIGGLVPPPAGRGPSVIRLQGRCYVRAPSSLSPGPLPTDEHRMTMVWSSDARTQQLEALGMPPPVRTAFDHVAAVVDRHNSLTKKIVALSELKCAPSGDAALVIPGTPADRAPVRRGAAAAGLAFCDAARSRPEVVAFVDYGSPSEDLRLSPRTVVVFKRGARLLIFLQIVGPPTNVFAVVRAAAPHARDRHVAIIAVKNHA